MDKEIIDLIKADPQLLKASLEFAAMTKTDIGQYLIVYQHKRHRYITYKKQAKEMKDKLKNRDYHPSIIKDMLKELCENVSQKRLDALQQRMMTYSPTHYVTSKSTIENRIKETILLKNKQLMRS
jgi:hypothetical protein